MKLPPAFDWRTIRNLAESKSFLLFNALLVTVPFLVRLGMDLALDTFALYLAAFVLVICSTLYVMTFPEVMKYNSLSKFRDAGKTPKFLKKSYEKYVGKISEITDSHVKTRLENENGASGIDAITFEYVQDAVNESNNKMRLWITRVYYLAFSLMALAYVYRLLMVIWAFVKQQ